MKAIRLQCEYMTSPLGLGKQHPRLMWNCEDGVFQTAFQIITDQWDSGKVKGSSMHTEYPLPLADREVVFWKLRLWDENDIPGPWAESSFEMGVTALDAKWVAGARPEKNMRNPADCFRRRFTAPGKIAKARLYASACGVYDIMINQTRVEDFFLAPGMTDYRKRIQVQTYDVTELLSVENTIELRLADGWYRGSVAAYGVTNVFGTQTSIAAQLEITYEDGKVQTVITDSSWDWSNDGPIRFADLKDGEVYDAAKQPSYRGRARIVESPKAKICASNNVSVTEHERFSAKLLPDKVLDFGQNIAGILEFTVKGKAGQRIRIVCGETLDQYGHMDLSGIQETRPAKGWTLTALIRKLTQNKVNGITVQTPRQEIIFFCSGKEDHYKMSFSVFGFRYAQLETDVDFDPASFTAVAVYSDLERTGSFACSDIRINRLVENIRWSMKSNFLDVPTDCPTRERLGWTGDAQIFFDTGAYLMNTAPFFAKWMQDMEDAQYKNGLLPAVVPYSGVEMMYKSTGSSVGWADAVYLIPYRYYKRFGDERILQDFWPMIRRYADYLLKKREKDGHYEKGVHLGEWLEPEEFREKKYGAGMKHPEECTAYLYLAMTIIGDIAGTLGETACQDVYRQAADMARHAYLEYAEIDTGRQAKLVRPLALGLYDDERKLTAQKRLKQAVENYDYRVGTGFLSTPFLLGVLSDAGEVETAYRLLLNEKKPGWLAEIQEGATTIWEDWEGRLSLNHYSPGAVCQWLFDTCTGIRVDGENHFTIAPVPGGGLEFADAEYQSVYGKVSSCWEKTMSGYCFEIHIPANCTADICLPGGKTEHLISGKHRLTTALT